ncbi:hypothetical protein GVAV_003426 [Gurleya vavrai]
MKLIIIGPPGSGKGTQAKMLSQKYRSINLNHISTGDLLRAEIKKGTEKGDKINNLISNGQFVPDSLIEELLEPEIKNNFILDGYPRNLSQAERFKTNVDCVIFLELEMDDCINRILKRGEGRADDNIEIAKERIGIYVKNTAPVVEFFDKKKILHRINGMKSVNEIFNQICEIVKQYE